MCLQINPQHTLPILVDNGNKLWDSHAISTYLIGKYAKDDQLYPKDLYSRAKIDQRLHFDSGILFPRIRNSTISIFFQKGTEFSAELIASGYEAYDHVENFLKDDPYIVGDHLTLADLAFVTSITQMEAFAPLDEAKYPKIRGWLNRLQSELSYLQEINTSTVAHVKGAFLKKIKENQVTANQ